MKNNKTPSSFRLRLIAGVGFSVIFLAMLLVADYQRTLTSGISKEYGLLAQLKQLENASAYLKKRGEYYVENAPRDFESYRRDVAVFHREMQEDLSTFEQSLSALINGYHQSQKEPLHWLEAGAYVEQKLMLSSNVNEAESGWQRFKLDLNEKLGDNPQEPRIEWGAKFIANNIDGLNQNLNNLIMAYRQLINLKLENGQQLLSIASIVTGAVMLLGILFVFWIVWRIGSLAQACQQVANGNFGLQLSSGGKDELGLMTRAFNSLSGRIELILGLFEKLNASKSSEEALQAFWMESNNYLDADWIGLMEQSTDGTEMQLTQQASSISSLKWRHKKVSLLDEKGIGFDLAQTLISNKVFMIDDTKEYPYFNLGSAFFRELLQKTMIRSVMILPLKNQDGSWQGALIMGKRIHKTFSPDQLEMVHNLAPVIGSIFANATDHQYLSGSQQKQVVNK